MIGIQAIFTEIPGKRLNTLPREAELGLRAGTVRERIGVHRIARKGPEQEASDLAVAAIQKAFDAGVAAAHQVDCLVVVTQNPDGQGLPHTAAIVHGKLGLPERCAAFDISLGCSGYVYALAIVKSFMEANGLRCGLLITSDPYSRIVDDQDRRTALLFGDAAAATLLTDQPVWSIGRFDMGTRGSQGSSLEVRKTPNGKLFMDGKAVLRFSTAYVPESLLRTIALNGMTLEQVDRIVLHQGSLVVVESIADSLVAADKTAFYARDYGNTVSSSIPIVLAENLQPGDRHVAISGFGVGLSWASSVLSRVA